MQKTDEEWRGTLTPEQFNVLRKHGTEPPGSSPLNSEKRAGMFACAGCGQQLFESGTKFESGTGWPSFFAPVADENLSTAEDRSHFMHRTEVMCAACDAKLGRHEMVPLELLRAICSHCCSRWTAQTWQAVS